MNFEELSLIRNADDLKSFVDKEITNAINNTEHENVIGMEHVLPHKGFIDNNTKISNVDSDWIINDNNYAYYFFDGLRKCEIKNISDALNRVYSFTIFYFGEYTKPEIREQIIRSTPPGKRIDISTLARKNTAICTERAAIVQNLVTLLGVESYFVVGNIYDKDEQVPHAYNILRVNEKFYLYDVSKDIQVEINGKIKYQPYIKAINIEQVQTLFNAGQINTGDRIYDSFGKYNIQINEEGKKIK